MAGEHGASAKPLHVPNGLERLPTGWSWGRLDDLCEGVFDCPHSTPKLVDAGPFVVRTQDIITGVFRTEQAAHVCEETYRERTVRALPRRGDLLYSREGTYFGIAAEVPERVRVCLGQRMVLIRPLARKVDFRFLRHWLNSPIMAAHIHGHRDGSVAERLNLPTIRALPVAVPPPSEQRAIAHILGTLDDKIKLNRRRNQTLEAMARALFKDWFVDFGPVRAKMEGREPYLPADLWQLFPERLDDEGKPEGWSSKRASDFLTLAYGKALPSSKRNIGDIPVYGSGGITGYHDEALINGPAVIVGRKGTVGSLYWEDRPSFPIDTVFYVQPAAPLSFCYYLLGNLPLRDMNTDAAVPGLNRENVYRLDVTQPPGKLVTSFANIATRLRKSIAAISREVESITELRDTLLPKLISGELRIADAEKFLEHARARACVETTAT